MAAFGQETRSVDDLMEVLRAGCETRFGSAREAFRALEESNDNYITPANLALSFRRLFAVEISLDTALALVRRLERNAGADRVSFANFAQTYDSSQKGQSPGSPKHKPLEEVEKLDMNFGAALEERATSLHESFLAVDTHRTGYISFDELADALARFGVVSTPEQTQQLCDLYDVKHNGKISYAEFVDRAKVRDRRPYAGHMNRQEDDLASGNNAEDL